jgi:NADPH:quinone reductase-like Zn-dependent oxidoreductase
MLAVNPAALRRLGDLVAQGVLMPRVQRHIGLDEVAQAQAVMRQGHARGKVVVLPQWGVTR